MVISAGYFQTTYFADRYWMANWWAEYGTAAFDYDDRLTHITVVDGVVTAASNQPYSGIMTFSGLRS